MISETRLRNLLMRGSWGVVRENARGRPSVITELQAIKALVQCAKNLGFDRLNPGDSCITWT